MTYPGLLTFPGSLTFPGGLGIGWPPLGLVPVSVARRPVPTVSEAPRGTVPRRVPWRPKIPVDAELGFEVAVSAVAAMHVRVDLPLPWDATYVADVLGGSVNVSVPVVWAPDVLVAESVVESATVEYPVQVGVGAVMEAAPVRPAGMNKSGSQSLTRDQRTMLTGWVVRSGFPETVIDGNRLRMKGAGTVVVSARIDFSDTGGSNQGRWIVHNGVDVASAVVSNQASLTLTSDPISVVDGDVIWVEAMGAASFSSQRTVVESTFVTVTPVP